LQQRLPMKESGEGHWLPRRGPLASRRVVLGRRLGYGCGGADTHTGWTGGLCIAHLGRAHRVVVVEQRQRGITRGFGSWGQLRCSQEEWEDPARRRELVVRFSRWVGDDFKPAVVSTKGRDSAGGYWAPRIGPCSQRPAPAWHHPASSATAYSAAPLVPRVRRGVRGEQGL